MVVDRHPPCPLTAAALALLVCLAAGAALLPPLVEVAVRSTLESVALAATLVLAMLAHWVCLGVAARRLGRSVSGWVALSVLLFPIGSAAALVLLSWLDEPPLPAPAH